MFDIKSQELSEIEMYYEKLRKKILIKLKNYHNDKIMVKASLSSTSPLQFFMKIKDDKLLKELTDKLDKNIIAFEQNNSTIKTSLAGISLSLGIISPAEQNELEKLEKTIFSLINDNFGIDSFVRVTNQMPYQWSAQSKNLTNTYFFKSLNDAHETFKNGYIKYPYSIINLFKWGLPVSSPNHWEMPSTINHVIQNNIKRISLDFEYINTLHNKSQLIDVLTNKSKEGILDVGKIALIMESIVREIKLVEEFRNSLKKNHGFRIINHDKVIIAFENEFEFRRALFANGNELSEEIIEKSKKLNNSLENIISKETKKNLEKKKFLKDMIEGVRELSLNHYFSNSFINNIIQWSKSNNIEIPQINEWDKNTQNLYLPIIAILSILSISKEYSFSNAISANKSSTIPRQTIDTFVDGTIDISFSAVQVRQTQQLALSMYDVATDLTFAGYNVLASIYSAVQTVDGVNTVMSLNQWIKKIQQSSIIDDETKQLITDYFKRRKNHTIIGDCIGKSILSSGQFMMFLGCPVGGFGAPLIIPGAVISILGAGITVGNNLITTRKFGLINPPSKNELTILGDNKNIPLGTINSAETQFHANLRWQCSALKNESIRKEKNLLWLNIFSEIINNSYTLRNGLNESDLDKLSQKIIAVLEKKYLPKYTSNMAKHAKITFGEKETKNEIILLISNFIKNPAKFYLEIINNFILDKSEDISINQSKTTADNGTKIQNIQTTSKLYAHSKYSHILSLVKKLKESALWEEAERNLLKRLIINKKSDRNIRCSYFDKYVNKINIKQKRYVYLPPILPIVNISFRNPIFPFKAKTVYLFNEDKFFSDLAIYSKLPPEKRLVLDKVIGAFMEERKNSIAKTITHQGNQMAKSDVYRPLWHEIPQLIQKEFLNDR